MTKKKAAGKKKPAAAKRPRARKPADGESKRGPGRITTYKAEYAPIAKRLCEMGAIDTEVAAILGIHKSTLYRWYADHPDFQEAVRVGKEPMNERLRLSLMREANGYELEKELKQYDTKRGVWVSTTVIEYQRPNARLLDAALKNRMPDEFRDRQEITGANGGPLTVEIVRFDEGPASA